MKILLVILIIVHGLIHLLGFVKAVGWAELKQLTKTISRPWGYIWLIVALVWMATGVLLVINFEYWWIFSWLALAGSVGLIITQWKDAKFGMIANLLILVYTIVGSSAWRFHHRYQQDVEKGIRETETISEKILTEDDIRDLPQPVQKYIRYAGCIGKPQVKSFSVVFNGKIRKDEKSDWMPFTSEQYNFLQLSTRLFFMEATMKNFPVAGYHAFFNGDAMMDIRLFSLINVQFQDGDLMDRAETVTFFNDMCCMAPATLIDSRIKWKTATTDSVEAVFTNNNISIKAVLYFNDSGQLVNFKSNDRMNADTGTPLPWETPLSNYKRIDGHLLPGYAETIYTYPDRKLCYGTFETMSVKYNVTNEMK